MLKGFGVAATNNSITRDKPHNTNEKNISALEKKIRALENKLVNKPKEINYHLVKSQLAVLLVQKGDALTESGKYLKACKTYYLAYKLTRHKTAAERLGFSKQKANCKNSVHKTGDLNDISSMQPSECFLRGLQALSGIGLDKHDDHVAFNYFKVAANEECPAFWNQLGWMYSKGRGVKRDYQKAVSWYLKAVEQGYALAQYNLSWCYIKGYEVKRNYQKAAFWLLKAAEQGYALAQYNLSWCYIKGYGVEQNYQEAASWLLKAAEQGYAPAQDDLGCMYIAEQGIEQDYEQANFWFHQAAEQGYEQARFHAAWMYAQGFGKEPFAMFNGLKSITSSTTSSASFIGIQQKTNKLIQQLKNKSDKINPSAIKSQLANLLIQYGTILTERKDFLTACQAYNHAYELTGHRTAAERLGFSKPNAKTDNKAHEPDDLNQILFMQPSEIFLRGLQALSGIGLNGPNDQLAFNYFYSSAEKGYPSSWNQLGWMYCNGRGVKQDYQKAVFWFLKAAERGDSKAQYSLGWMYFDGHWFEQNYQKAAFWFFKAAQQGCALEKII